MYIALKVLQLLRCGWNARSLLPCHCQQGFSVARAVFLPYVFRVTCSVACADFGQRLASELISSSRILIKTSRISSCVSTPCR